MEIVEFMLQTAVHSLNVAESRIELGQRLPEPDLDAPLLAVGKAKKTCGYGHDRTALRAFKSVAASPLQQSQSHADI